MAKQRAFASQEREFQAQRVSRLGRALLMSIATTLTFLTIALLAADQLFRPDTFSINQLTIKGKFRHLDPHSIEQALSKEDLGNFFSVDLDAVKQKVEELAWVQVVDVRREWPNALTLSVTEQRPVMRWGKERWVSSAGRVIDLPAEVEIPNAIVLSGNEKDAPHLLQRAFSWKSELRASGLSLRGVSLSSSQAWMLRLYDPKQDSTFELLLGREQIAERLSRFQKLFATHFKNAEQRLIRVDARYPDGLAVRAEKIKPNDAASNSVAAIN